MASPAASPAAKPDLAPDDPPAELSPCDVLGVDVIGKAEPSIRSGDVARVSVVVARRPREAGGRAGQLHARDQRGRPWRAGLFTQGEHEPAEQARRLASVVGLPHPRLERRQSICVERRSPTSQRCLQRRPAMVLEVDTQRREPGMSADPGMFGPDSEAWRFDREAMLLLGAGPRALLLQLAHPAVAAGVDEHSDFRTDPWRRLDGTLRSYLRIIYGSTGAARAEIRRLNGLHRGITGTRLRARATRRCRCGSTRRWSTRRSSRTTRGPARCSRDRGGALLRRDQADRPGLRRAGPRRCPSTSAAFETYLADADGPGRAGARSATRRGTSPRSILHPPLPGALARAGVPSAAVRLDAVAVVGAPADRRSARPTASAGDRSNAAVSAWLVVAWRAWNPVLPAVLPADAAGTGSGAADRRGRRLWWCPRSVERREARPEERRQVDRRRVVERRRAGSASSRSGSAAPRRTRAASTRTASIPSDARTR